MDRYFLKLGRNALLAGLSLLSTRMVAFAQRSLDTTLKDLASPDLQRRSKALYTLLPPIGWSGMRSEVSNLLRTHPTDVERIRTALIGALEAQAAEHDKLIKNQEQMSESFLEYWLSLTDAVASLKDPRAVRGLLVATMSGAHSSVDGLADVCPMVVDSIVQRAHEPELFWRGWSLDLRARTINVLGNCLRRPAADFSPGDLARIRRELISGLDDADSNLRGVSATALIPLRNDPAVQAKLKSMANTDSYVSAVDGSSSFPVRQAAERALNPPKDLLFYVTRSPDTRACRVQQESEAVWGEIFLGPISKQVAQDRLCSHYDSTGQDVSLCWLTDPANACVQNRK